jgi:uncharacterized protein YidB (DUF937 family)
LRSQGNSEIYYSVFLRFTTFTQTEIHNIMLDQIMQFAKEQVGDQVKSNADIDDHQKDEVFNAAQGGIMETIKNQIGGGNLSGLMNMFNGDDDPNDENNPINQDAKGNVVKSLMDKLGIDESKAAAIASQVLPSIMNRFASKDSGTAADAGDLMSKIGLDGDNNIMDMVSKFTGGNAGGMMDKVKGLFGGN